MVDQPPSLAQIINFVNSLYQQCRDIIRDTVRILRDDEQICLAHKKTWDYTFGPNDRFLEQDCSLVRRCWSTFLPTENVQRGALFDIEFWRVNQLVTPALTYGALNPGVVGFTAADRWAPYNTTFYAETGTGKIAVTHNGPIAVLTGEMPNYFEEATIVRVPLESLVDQASLRRCVVLPLAALLKGRQQEALALLEGVTTELWPCKPTNVLEEETADPELP